jgi:3-oxoacyl-[acyl-carrier protein] reductase
MKEVTLGSNVQERPLALITGASRGIGAAIALRLAADGYDIWLNYKSNTKAAELIKSRVEQSGVQCKLFPFDVANEEEVKSILAPELEQRIPDVLVNNAGFAKDTLLVWMSFEEWKSVIDVTLNGFFLITKAVLFGMLKRKSGKIINITSTAGLSGLAGQANYSAAKAGLIGATKSLAKEVVTKGIYVNAVAPGFIETDMISHLPKEKILPFIPMQRAGLPEEISGVVSFLCSPDASYITGQVIPVNGGL